QGPWRSAVRSSRSRPPAGRHYPRGRMVRSYAGPGRNRARAAAAGTAVVPTDGDLAVVRAVLDPATGGHVRDISGYVCLHVVQPFPEVVLGKRAPDPGSAEKTGASGVVVERVGAIGTHGLRNCVGLH